MNITIVKKIPTPEEIVQLYPLSEKGHEQIVRDRQEVRDILSGKDKRLLFLVGPCSAWPKQAVLEYAKKLKVVADAVQDKIKVVMRVYIQKPRTTKGWTGPVNQPDPFAPPDIAEGIKYCRSLMVQVIEMGLPIADEALFTHNAKGFIELLSWVCIGARSVEDQEHRIFASSVECPVGMKNSTTGSIEVAINGIIAAQNTHVAAFHGYQIETNGNPYAHLVLRGSGSGPNYAPEYLQEAKVLFEKNKITNPAIIIDASHDNCRVNGAKDCRAQPMVVKEVLSSLQAHPELRPLVKGFMLESFIKEGNQKAESLTADSIDQGGLSITDPCLSWEATEQLLREIAEKYV